MVLQFLEQLSIIDLIVKTPPGFGTFGMYHMGLDQARSWKVLGKSSLGFQS